MGNRNHKQGLHYNSQSHRVQTIIKKYWNILKETNILDPVLHDNRKFAFKKAPNLAPTIQEKDKTIKRHPTATKGGFVYCIQCMACKCIKLLHTERKRELTSTSVKETFNMKELLMCDSKGVICFIQVPCGLQYIGWTKREF